MPSLREPFRHPTFVRFFAGQATSLLGDYVFILALPWQVLVLTGSGVDLGVVLAVFSASQVAFLLFGGIIVDRVDRRALVVAMDVISGVLTGALAALGLAGVLQVAHLYAFAVLFGVASAVSMPALSAFLPETVPPAAIQSANSLYQGSRTIASIAGPALGAAIIASAGANAVLGTAAAFAFDAGTFLVSAALLATARREGNPRPAPEAKGSMLAQARDGWRYVARVPWLWITVLLFAFVNLAEAGPRNVVLPAYVGVDLGGKEVALGAVLSAAALGSLVGYFAPGFLPPIKRRGLVAYLATAAGGGTLVLWSLTTNLYAIYAVSFLHGLSWSLFGLMWQTALMEQVREDMRGRVFSLDALGSFILLPLSMAGAGALSAAAGPPFVFLVGGLSIVVLAGVGLAYRPAHVFEGPEPREAVGTPGR